VNIVTILDFLPIIQHYICTVVQKVPLQLKQPHFDKLSQINIYAVVEEEKDKKEGKEKSIILAL